MSEDGRAFAVGVQLYSPKLTQPGWHTSRFLHVRVFEYSRGYWNQLGDDIDGKVTDGQDDFGPRVAMSEDGSTIVVGGSLTRFSTGHVRVFEYVSGIWNQLGDTIYGEAAFDAFGSSVAISKDEKTIVGGYLQYGPHIRDSGHARVFEYSSGSWNQLGGVIDGNAAGDMFGASVSMSGDGRTIIAAAIQDSWDGAGTGIGYARVFEYSSGSWNQVGNAIVGEGSNDVFGTSVAMSEDGRTIVAGALKKGDGDNAGQVRVFTRPTDIEVEERPTNIEVGESSGFVGARTVGVLILVEGAAYFLWKRTLKPRTKTDHGSTELVPISLAVPVDGHGID